MKNHKRFCAIMLNYERFCPITLNYAWFWLSVLNHKWFCAYNAKPYKMFCWAVLNPKGSVLWMQNFEGFCRSMLNHRRLSLRLYRTKKVLSATTEPCRVLPVKCRTMESYLFDYTESKRFCRQMLNLEGFCPLMLNHTSFFVGGYWTEKVLSLNSEP